MPAPASSRLKVVTTLFPIFDFARSIGQDQVEVSLLLPPGVESHSFEPTPANVIAISQADIFAYTGKFMEPWVEDIVSGVNNPHLTIVDESQGITLAPATFQGQERPEAVDPHIWLDFDNAQVMVTTLAAAFAQKDPAHAALYHQRSQEYIRALQALDQRYRSTLAQCRSREIVYGGHYAMGYLARRYNLIYTAAQGISPNAEPTANDLAQLVERIKHDHLTYIFYEELSSPKIAQTLSQETGAQLLLLNAAHNVSKEQLEQGATFLSLMEQNLAQLKRGLDCP